MTITGDALFIGLILMGAFFMLFSMKRPNILLAFVTFLIWFSMGMWLFFSTGAPIGVGEDWQDMLAWVFMIVSFLPWVFQMDTEIKHEGKGTSWTDYGRRPEDEVPNTYEAWRLEMRRKLGRKD